MNNLANLFLVEKWFINHRNGNNTCEMEEAKRSCWGKVTAEFRTVPSLSCCVDVTRFFAKLKN